MAGKNFFSSAIFSTNQLYKSILNKFRSVGQSVFHGTLCGNVSEELLDVFIRLAAAKVWLVTDLSKLTNILTISNVFTAKVTFDCYPKARKSKLRF